jgi:hypothetical protein
MRLNFRPAALVPPSDVSLAKLLAGGTSYSEDVEPGFTLRPL